MTLRANRQRIASFFPTAHRFAFVASDRQRIASIGGGGDCGSRRLGRSFALVAPPAASASRCRWRRGKPQEWAGEHAAAAARPPASVATPRRSSRRAVPARTDTSRRRQCRFRPTFVGVMRWRKNDPPNETMRCRFAPTEMEDREAVIFDDLPPVRHSSSADHRMHGSAPGCRGNAP